MMHNLVVWHNVGRIHVNMISISQSENDTSICHKRINKSGITSTVYVTMCICETTQANTMSMCLFI